MISSRMVVVAEKVRSVSDAKLSSCEERYALVCFTSGEDGQELWFSNASELPVPEGREKDRLRSCLEQ